MNDMVPANDRQTRKTRLTGPFPRPAAVVRQRRIQLGFDQATGAYRLAMV